MSDMIQTGDRIIGTSKAFTHRVGQTGTVEQRAKAASNHYWIRWDHDQAIQLAVGDEIRLLKDRTIENVHLIDFHELARNYFIFFTVIDGVPDTNSIKMEELT